MRSMEEVRFGVLGAAGFAARRPIPGLVRAQGCSLAAIHGLAQEADSLKVIAARHHVPKIYTSAAELIRDPQIDAVYIAMPVDLHREHTILAADAGKHVLVEKPMALSISEGEEMLAACRRKQVKLQIGYMRRFHPCHVRAKELIDQRTLGQIVEARIQTHLWYPPQQDAWRQDPRRGGGGAFMDMGSHCLELMEFLLGEATEVQGFIANVAFDYPVEDLSLVVLRFACGAMGIIDASFAIPYRENLLEIYGTGGTLLARRTAGPFSDPELLLLDERGATPLAVPEGKDQYQAEFEHFARAILDGTEPAVNGEAGLRNLRQILAVYASARENHFVKIES